MSEENQNQETEQVKNNVQENSKKVNIEEMADEVRAGDEALNRLKVQNLDFILDIPLKVSV